MSDVLDDVIKAIVAELIAATPSALYGDGSADIVYSEDTTVSTNVYARSIAVQPNVVLTISTTTTTPVFLYAREFIRNRGTIRSNGAPAVDAAGGGSGDYSGADRTVTSGPASPPIYLITPTDFTAYFTAGAPGSGGTIPTDLTTSGLDRSLTATPAWADIHTPNQFYARLEDPDQFFRLQGGSAGAQTPGAVGGAGGESGGFIGLIAPEIDNWDGVIEAKGGAGSTADAGGAVDEWTVATAYASGDYVIPTTPNLFVYQANYGGNSHATTEPTWPLSTTMPAFPTVTPAASDGDSDDNAAITPPNPAGLTDGDLKIAIVGYRTSVGTIATPAGWTTSGNAIHSAGGLRLSTYRRIHVGGDAAPTFTPSGGSAGDTIGGFVVAFRGVTTTGDTFDDGAGPSEGTIAGDVVGPVGNGGFLITPAKNGIVLAFFIVDAALVGATQNPSPGGGLNWNGSSGLVVVGSVGDGLSLVAYYAETPTATPLAEVTFNTDLPGGIHNWLGGAIAIHPLIGAGSVYDNADIRWDNVGPYGIAGGGGGGSGGVVATICREWNGGQPILTGGAGGGALSTGGVGVTGGTGFFIKVVDR